MSLDVTSFPRNRACVDLDGVRHSNGSEEIFDTVTTVAAAGSAQGDAAALGDGLSIVSAADGTKGVILPAASQGRKRFVYNTHATNGLKVYPPTSGDINDGTANAAVTIEGKSLAIFLALDTTTWAAIYTANS